MQSYKVCLEMTLLIPQQIFFRSCSTYNIMSCSIGISLSKIICPISYPIFTSNLLVAKRFNSTVLINNYCCMSTQELPDELLPLIVINTEPVIPIEPSGLGSAKGVTSSLCPDCSVFLFKLFPSFSRLINSS